MPADADIRISDHGTVFLFHPLTPSGQSWLDENIGAGAMMFGDAVVVEHHYARDLAIGMQTDGLTLE